MSNSMRSVPFVVTLAWLSLMPSPASAASRTVRAERCGTAVVDPADLDESQDIVMHAFSETGVLRSLAGMQLPRSWRGIQYACRGYVVEVSLLTGKIIFASGVCRFWDGEGNTILASMRSSGNRVDFTFHHGTGRWQGVTGNGSGSRPMPFAEAGVEHCAPLTLTIHTP